MNRKKFLLYSTSLLILFSSSFVYAEYCQYSWSNMFAEFDDFRYRHGTAAADDLLFIWGGTSSAYKHQDLQVYDPLADSWTTLAQMPDVQANFGFTEVDGFLYTISGEGPLGRTTDSYCYDILYDAWHQIANYPAGDPKLIGIMCSGGGDGKLYCFGGMEPSSIISTASTLAFTYDPANDSWSPLADMPDGKGFGYAAYQNGKIYLVGNFSTDNGTIIYDIATDSYEMIPEPDYRHAPILASAGDLLWLAGGGDVWDELTIFDQYFDSIAWHEMPTSFGPGRVAAGCGYIEGYGIFVTGGSWSGDPAGSSDTFLWTICVPVIDAVEPTTGSANTEITISAMAFEENVIGYLYDDVKTEYSFNDFTVVDENTITAIIPSDLPNGTYNLALVGSVGQSGRLINAFTVIDDDLVDDDQAIDDDQNNDDDQGDDDSTAINDSNDDDGDDTSCGC